MTATRRRTQVKNERRVERNDQLLASPYLTQASVSSTLLKNLNVYCWVQEGVVGLSMEQKFSTDS